MANPEQIGDNNTPPRSWQEFAGRPLGVIDGSLGEPHVGGPFFIADAPHSIPESELRIAAKIHGDPETIVKRLMVNLGLLDNQEDIALFTQRIAASGTPRNRSDRMQAATFKAILNRYEGIVEAVHGTAAYYRDEYYGSQSTAASPSKDKIKVLRAATAHLESTPLLQATLQMHSLYPGQRNTDVECVVRLLVSNEEAMYAQQEHDAI